MSRYSKFRQVPGTVRCVSTPPAYSNVAKIRLLLGGDHDYVFVDGSVPTEPAPGTAYVILCYLPMVADALQA